MSVTSQVATKCTRRVHISRRINGPILVRSLTSVLGKAVAGSLPDPMSWPDISVSTPAPSHSSAMCVNESSREVIISPYIWKGINDNCAVLLTKKCPDHEYIYLMIIIPQNCDQSYLLFPNKKSYLTESMYRRGTSQVKGSWQKLLRQTYHSGRRVCGEYKSLF